MDSVATPAVRYALASSQEDPRSSAVEPDMPLWRYVDLAKLISLLDTRALFFTRADLLGDPFEGSITAHRLALRRESESRQRSRGLPVKLTSHSQAIVQTDIANTVINCWHMNEHESAAMWRLYLSSHEGVAIRSSYARLLSSFPRMRGAQRITPDGWNHALYVRVATVKYIDFDTERTGFADPFEFKRTSFAHERELRLIVRDNSKQGDPRPSRFPAGGDYVPVSLNKLVQAIYVAPNAPKWFTSVIRSLVARYGYRFPVSQSALVKSPLH